MGADDDVAIASDTTARRAALRVLIAEDEAIIRLDLKEMLQEEGYDVVAEADNGQVALERARELKPDLVIMDVKMPIRNGLDAAQDIARERIAPVVMLTAFSQREFVEKAREAGAMAYLVKPFSKSDLVPAIEIAVSRFRELAALEGEVKDLVDRLETRKLVDRAKGVLMDKHAMTEPEAFGWIQRAAMDRRTSMRRVAEVVIDSLTESR
jgi:AmiR/NasT family two-component response regulator